jgi:ATP-dependent RNA helicase DeaD
MQAERFEDLAISRELRKAVQDVGFEVMTPIQVKAIPLILEGRDIIGQAQTGTGKTLAFGLPILDSICPSIRKTQAIVLCPTRELAVQVAEELKRVLTYKRDVKVLAVYGGQPIEQQNHALRAGVHIVIGTPGRTIDHINRGTLRIDTVKTAVLDEADEMLNMGFIDDVETILRRTPAERQTLLFSATMPKPILALTRKYQRQPEFVKVVQRQLTVPRVKQYYLGLREGAKVDVLCRLIDIHGLKSSLVFCNMKKRVDKVVMELEARGYPAQGLHGDMTQPQRMRAMDRFRRNRSEILVATDVAARGIDVEDIEAVFNYDLPKDEEYYVHRIGRTARAGKSGQAFSFVVGREIGKLREIETYAATKIACMPVPSPNDAGELKASSLLEKVKARVDGGGLEQCAQEIALFQQEGYRPLDIAAALLKMAMEGEDENSTQRTESTFQDRSLSRKGTSGRTAKRRNWPRVQNRRSLDVRDVVQYVK